MLRSITQFLNRLWNYLINHYIFTQIALPMEPSMDLNAFPDLVLRAIFDRVPLLDLGRHIPLVCHRWHALQPSVLSGKIKALTFVVGPAVSPTGAGASIVSILHEDELTNEDGSPMFPSSMDDPKVALTLTFPTLTSNRVDSLIGALRNVEYLKISVRKDERQPCTDAETIPLIGRLLGHWAVSLKTLKLDCSLTYNENSTFQENQGNPQLLTDMAVQLDRLIKTVNALPLLEHLTMDLNKDLRKATESIDLPILGRLKEFYFSYEYGKVDLLFRSLRRYAEPNRQLRSIGLGISGMMDQYLGRFGQSSLAKRFTILSRVGEDVLGFYTNVEERTRFLNTFSNLTFYIISMKDLNLERLTTTLAPLTRLVHLFLVSNVEPFSNFDTDSVDAIRPLPSVKVLTLLVMPSNSRLHTEFASPHWGRIFPNLQIIMLYHDEQGCSICGFRWDASEPEELPPCVRQTLLSFKEQCGATLKKVYYCHNRDYDNIKVFTPDTI